MLTVLSSFSQEESKNISDNLKRQVKEKFEQLELILSTTRFLGYDKDGYGELVIMKIKLKLLLEFLNFAPMFVCL